MGQLWWQLSGQLWGQLWRRHWGQLWGHFVIDIFLKIFLTPLCLYGLLESTHEGWSSIFLSPKSGWSWQPCVVWWHIHHSRENGLKFVLCSTFSVRPVGTYRDSGALSPHLLRVDTLTSIWIRGGQLTKLGCPHLIWKCSAEPVSVYLCVLKILANQLLLQFNLFFLSFLLKKSN